MIEHDPAASCYLLCLYNPLTKQLRVGSLGKIDWPSGWTYYSGRASRGWPTRIKRFFAPGGFRRFWHIDYLVAANPSGLKGIIPVSWPGDGECRLSGILHQTTDLLPLSGRFGASDCRAGCAAHAWTGQLPPERLYNILQPAGVPVARRIELQDDRATFV